MVVKFSNKKKRMAILKSTGNVKSGEMLITRSKGDGSTVGVMGGRDFMGRPIWRTFDTEEILLAIAYVTASKEDLDKLASD